MYHIRKAGSDEIISMHRNTPEGLYACITEAMLRWQHNGVELEIYDAEKKQVVGTVGYSTVEELEMAPNMQQDIESKLRTQKRAWRITPLLFLSSAFLVAELLRMLIWRR